MHLKKFLESNKMFYILLLLSLGLVLFTYPFLKYPYDMFHHLIVIDNLYHTSSHTWDIPSGRSIWHFIWAKIFYIFTIPSDDMFFRAKIIHVTQTYIALFSIYYFSHVAIRNTFKQLAPLHLKYLSFWSVVIWVTIFATFSVKYQMVWNLWYSINYQITLPLFWYTTALTLVLFLEKTSRNKKIFFILQILLLSRFILQAHSMEYSYYLMHLGVFAFVFMDNVYGFVRKNFIIVLMLSATLIFFIKKYQPESSNIFNYLSLEKLPELYEKILHSGNILLKGYNRSSASINELMYIILGLSILMLMHFLWSKYKLHTSTLNTRVLFFILLTSMFVLIPLYQYSSGLFALITRTMVVNRLYYSSSLFLLIPISVYYFYNIGTKRPVSIFHVNLLIFTILASTWLFSRYNTGYTQNYYKNISSIKNSFSKEKVGFNLSDKQILTIGKLIQNFEANKRTNKELFFYARADIAFVIKYIYHKNVYWEKRRANPDYKKIYNSHQNHEYEAVLVNIPKDFPLYKPYH